MYCKHCADQIEQERLDILPATVFCASCARTLNVVKPRKGVLVFTHKTGGELQTMSADYFEKNKQYFIPQNGSGRSVMKNFSKNICV